MVVHHQPEGLCGNLDLLCHRDVGLRRGWITRGMVVYQDQGRSVQFQRPFNHFAWVDGHVIDRPLGLFFVCDQDVLAVQKEDAKLLSLAVRHDSVTVIK